MSPPSKKKKTREKRPRSDRLRARKSVNHSTCEHVTALLPRTIAQCASTCRYLARGHHAASERFTANTCKAVFANGRQHQGTEHSDRARRNCNLLGINKRMLRDNQFTYMWGALHRVIWTGGAYSNTNDSVSIQQLERTNVTTNLIRQPAPTKTCWCRRRPLRRSETLANMCTWHQILFKNDNIKKHQACRTKLAIESNMPRRTCQTQHPSCDRCRTIYRAHILALLYYNNVTYFESHVSRNVARCQQQGAITVGLESCRTNTSTNNTIDLDRSFLSFNPKIDLFADINSHCHARPPSTCAARAAYSGQTKQPGFIIRCGLQRIEILK